MSDDDRANDIECDADKRAHHNALERKRRDHIKESFANLRDSLPAFQGEKIKNEPKSQSQGRKRAPKASRAQILEKAADYIQSMGKKTSVYRQDYEDLKRHNRIIKELIRTLEKAKATGDFAAAAAAYEAARSSINRVCALSGYDGVSDSEDSSDDSKDGPRKRLKPNSDVSLHT